MTPPTPTEVEELARELRLQAWYSDPHQFARWILTRFVRREERQHHFDLLLEDNARLRAELRTQRCDGSGKLRIVVEKWERGQATELHPCPSCPACKPDATPQAKCECGHVREQHTQGCRVIGCDCPYYAPPDATPKGDEWEPCKLCGCPEGRCPGAEVSCHGNPCFHVRDGSRTRESVPEAEHQASELGASRADSAAPVVHVVKPPMQLPNYICMYCLREEHPKPCQEFFEKTRRETVATSSTAPVNYCPECDGVLGKHAPKCGRTPIALPLVVQLHEDTVRALVAALSVLWPRDIRQNEGPVETADNLLAKLKETKP